MDSYRCPLAAAAAAASHTKHIPGTVPALPQEVIERIVDFNHADTASLRACSLSSRALCCASRAHTFGAVHLTTGNRARRDALAALMSASPCLARFVRALHVHGDHLACTEDTLPLVPFFAGVTRLQLYGTHFASFAACREYVLQLANLEHLSVHRVTWACPAGQAEDAVTETPTALRIHSLELGEEAQYGVNAALLRWIGGTTAAGTIKRFSVRGTYAQNVVNTQEFLSWNGPSARELDVFFTHGFCLRSLQSYTEVLENYPLSGASPITTISLAVDCEPLRLRLAFELLANTRLPHVRTIRLRLLRQWPQREFVVPKLLRADVSALDAAMYPALENIEVRFAEACPKTCPVRNAKALLEQFRELDREGVAVKVWPEGVCVA